jgi:hypothetical protein
MPLIARKTVMLCKIESSYATDPTPTGASNALLVYNANITPLEQILVPREVVRPFMGNFDQLAAAGYCMAEFEVEIAGAGTGGSAPGYGPLLRACGLSQTLNASAVTGTAQSGTATTIVLAAALAAADDAFNGCVIRITGGAGSGQRRLITDYTGASDTATINKAWDTNPDNTSTYSIDAAAFYAPVSTGFESVTIYFFKDGVRHEMNGCRGTVSFGLNRLGRPTMRFRLLGLYVAVDDTANPVPTLTGFQQPLPVNNTNTTAFSLHGYAAWVLDNLAVDLANQVTYRHLVGSETIQITDRAPAGSVLVEAVTVAAKDIWAAIRSVTQDDMTIKHGTAAGNTVYLDAPCVQLVNPRYSQQDGIEMLGMDAVLIPSASGNDEFYLTVA